MIDLSCHCVQVSYLTRKSTFHLVLQADVHMSTCMYFVRLCVEQGWACNVQAL